MAKKTVLSPLRDLAKLATERNGPRALKSLQIDHGKCTGCNAVRIFPGPLVLGIDVHGVDLPALMLLHETPANGKRESWSHAGRLHAELSTRVGSPQWLWQSMCPECAPNGILDEVARDAAEVARLAQEGKATDFRLDQCAMCHGSRQPVQLSGVAGFAGGLPCLAVSLYEIDRKHDLVTNQRPERWCFQGVLDLRHDPRAHQYRWRAICPACHAAKMPVGSSGRLIVRA